MEGTKYTQHKQSDSITCITLPTHLRRLDATIPYQLLNQYVLVNDNICRALGVQVIFQLTQIQRRGSAQYHVHSCDFGSGTMNKESADCPRCREGKTRGFQQEFKKSDGFKSECLSYVPSFTKKTPKRNNRNFSTIHTLRGFSETLRLFQVKKHKKRASRKLGKPFYFNMVGDRGFEPEPCQ